MSAQRSLGHRNVINHQEPADIKAIPGGTNNDNGIAVTIEVSDSQEIRTGCPKPCSSNPGDSPMANSNRIDNEPPRKPIAPEQPIIIDQPKEEGSSKPSAAPDRIISGIGNDSQRAADAAIDNEPPRKPIAPEQPIIIDQPKEEGSGKPSAAPGRITSIIGNDSQRAADAAIDESIAERAIAPGGAGSIFPQARSGLPAEGDDAEGNADGEEDGIWRLSDRERKVAWGSPSP